MTTIPQATTQAFLQVPAAFTPTNTNPIQPVAIDAARVWAQVREVLGYSGKDDIGISDLRRTIGMHTSRLHSLLRVLVDEGSLLANKKPYRRPDGKWQTRTVYSIPPLEICPAWQRLSPDHEGAFVDVPVSIARATSALVVAAYMIDSEGVRQDEGSRTTPKDLQRLLRCSYSQAKRIRSAIDTAMGTVRLTPKGARRPIRWFLRPTERERTVTLYGVTLWAGRDVKRTNEQRRELAAALRSLDVDFAAEERALAEELAATHERPRLHWLVLMLEERFRHMLRLVAGYRRRLARRFAARVRGVVVVPGMEAVRAQARASLRRASEPCSCDGTGFVPMPGTDRYTFCRCSPHMLAQPA